MLIRIQKTMRSTRAAVDLASIMIGTIVIGIIAGVIAATVFAVIPWAQDNAAKGTLDSMKTAQAAYQGFTNGDGFANKATLANPGAAVPDGKSLFKAGNNFNVVTDTSNDCYVAVVKSDSGNIFYTTEKMDEPKQYNIASPANPSCTPIAPIIVSVGGDAVAAEWDVPDAQLRKAIKQNLGHWGQGNDESTYQLMTTDAPLITNLSGHGIGVVSLEGLELATNLDTLWLNHSSITDLTPLRGLPITNLNLESNQITSLDGLQNMPLEKLYLSSNTGITDFSPLDTSHLTEVYLYGTNATDYSMFDDVPAVYGRPE